MQAYTNNNVSYPEPDKHKCYRQHLYYLYHTPVLRTGVYVLESSVVLPSSAQLYVVQEG